MGKPELPAEPVLLIAIEKLAELGDERAVPYLANALVSRQKKVAVAAAEAVERLMPEDLAGLVLLETKIRNRGWYGYDKWWPDARPSFNMFIDTEPARACLAETLPIAALGLLSVNANGYARELATRALADVADGQALPFLMLRANDWVSAVATIAQRAIEQRCTPAYSASFAKTQPLTERLKPQRRVDQISLVQKIEAMLANTAPGIAALSATLASSSDVTVRRAVARLVRAQAVPLERITPALSDRDAVVRTQLALAITEHASGAELERWLPPLFADRVPRIRALAFEAASKALPSVMLAKLPELVFDDNFWLREFARQKLAQRGPADFVGIYRAALEGGQRARLHAAMAGLSEVGKACDVGHILPYLSDSSVRTRQVALRAVCSLLKQEAMPHLLRALASTSPGLSKVAAELLRNRGLTVLHADISPFVDSALSHVRANALTLLATSDRWEALIAALERASDADQRVLKAAQAILARWRQLPADFYSGPGVNQRARLQAAMLRAPAESARLDSTLRALLR